jgi:transketolase
VNTKPNRQAICDALTVNAAHDRSITVVCSDSRGSASLGDFIARYPEQLVEVGIAEQDLVGVSAGLASCGMKAFAVSPACFITARSYEQVKVDVAYSHTNVKLVGISGGVSYGALGMSHHSSQDIAAMASIPNMRVYLPSDRFQTFKLINALLQDGEPAYLRVGRNAVEDVYSQENAPFELNKANVLREGKDIALIACGEMVRGALDAAEVLKEKNMDCAVVDMYCLKPFDSETLLRIAGTVKTVVTVEEHVSVGGLGSMVCQCLSANDPKRVVSLCLPDAPVVAGTSKQVFAYYGLDRDGIIKTCLEV